MPPREAGIAAITPDRPPDSQRQHHTKRHSQPSRLLSQIRSTATPPRRECARRGLDPVSPPNREDKTMQETVAQALAAAGTWLTAFEKLAKPTASWRSTTGSMTSPARAIPATQVRRNRGAFRLRRTGALETIAGFRQRPDFDLVGPRLPSRRARCRPRQLGQSQGTPRRHRSCAAHASRSRQQARSRCPALTPASS
jgi:hypothetical protein